VLLQLHQHDYVQNNKPRALFLTSTAAHRHTVTYCNVQICIESSKLLNSDQRKCCNYDSQTKYLPTASRAGLIMYVQLMRHSKYLFEIDISVHLHFSCYKVQL